MRRFINTFLVLTSVIFLTAACDQGTTSSDESEVSESAAVGNETPVTAVSEEKNVTATSEEVVETEIHEETAPTSDDTATGTPKFEFETEEYNFGTIVEGDVVNYTFKFKNIGDAPLIISSAKASCGCTAPDVPENKPIAPGATDEIAVTFKSTGKSGKQRKSVTIYSNVEGGSTKIWLTGQVDRASDMKGPLKNTAG